MAGLVDHEAVLADFEAFLVTDGRQSHGTDFLTRRLAELRAQHRIDESVDRQVLRRFGDHVVDTVLGALPNPVTNDPLTGDDPRASTAMNDGTAIPSLREEQCPTKSPPTASPRSRPVRDSQPVDDPATGSRPVLAAATIS